MLVREAMENRVAYSIDRGKTVGTPKSEEAATVAWLSLSLALDFDMNRHNKEVTRLTDSSL
jgi:hypothetical protein